MARIYSLDHQLPGLTDQVGEPIEVFEYRGVLAVVMTTNDQRSWMASHYAEITAPWITQDNSLDPWGKPKTHVQPHTCTIHLSAHDGSPFAKIREWVDAQLAPDDPDEQSWRRIHALRRRYLAGLETWTPPVAPFDTIQLPTEVALKG